MSVMVWWVISQKHKGTWKLRLEALIFPPRSVRPHLRENSCSWPHYSWWGTEIKEWSSGPIVLPEIWFRFHSYIQIILCSTAFLRAAIYHTHTHTVNMIRPSVSTYLHTAPRYSPDGATILMIALTSFRSVHAWVEEQRLDLKLVKHIVQRSRIPSWNPLITLFMCFIYKQSATNSHQKRGLRVLLKGK